MKHNNLGKSIEFKQSIIRYDDLGSGDSIVLLHGFLEDRSIWNELTDSIRNSYRVIAIDLPGHGESGVLGNVHSMEDMADAVHAVLVEIGIETAIIGGHSMGGYVALAFADLYPSMVKAIALINSTPFPDTEAKKLNRERAAEAVKHNQRNFVSLTLPSLFSDSNREKYSEEIEHLKANAFKMPVKGITAALLGMRDRPDRSQLMISGKFPFLLVIGKEDTVVSPESLVTLRGNNSVSVIELEGGHMSYIESKDDFSYFFMRFIENL